VSPPDAATDEESDSLATSQAGVYSTFFASAARHLTRRFGEFEILVTDKEQAGGEHVVLVRGCVRGEKGVLCRVTSACLTSTALNSAECDCAGQIDAALRLISKAERGVFIYLAQEGRGHGLTTKIRALRHKNRGLDTFQAVEALGLPADVRTYEVVELILTELNIESVVLLTSNPDKLFAITAAGVRVEEFIPLKVPAPRVARRHILAKRHRGHLL
jgi:3,4-dihydroxy 2-butanone 4-phosphate synthase / GTP cyclohydrolase II